MTPEQIERRRLVDIAKAVLMDEGLHEADAFALLQATVTDKGLTWEAAAQQVIQGARPG